MKSAVAARQEPIFGGYEKFRSSPASQATYRMKGPFAEVARGPNIHFADYDSDANAAYQCAIMWFINETGQCQESGRDQGHTQLGLAHLGDCCEIAWHQGLDLYGYADSLLLKGVEYTAKYNLGETVPFV
jgi:hypothetical protein